MSNEAKTDWITLIYGLLAMLITVPFILSMSLGIKTIYLELIAVALSLFVIFMIYKKGNLIMFKIIGVVILLLGIQFYTDPLALMFNDTSLLFQNYYLGISSISIIICGLQIFNTSD